MIQKRLLMVLRASLQLPPNSPASLAWQAVCRERRASNPAGQEAFYLVFQCFVYRPWPAFVRSFVASHRSVAVGSLPAALSDFSAFACSCNGHMSYICPLCSCRLSCLCFRPRLSNSGFQVSYPGSVVALPVRVLLPQRKQLRRCLLFRSLDSLEWINV